MSGTIHWLGTGLSSVAGIRYLIEQEHPVIVWNRSLEKARASLRTVEAKCDIRTLSDEALETALNPADILVSMLPATLHTRYARLCAQKGAHFVSSSYISEEMRHFDPLAKKTGIAMVNEVGLDPGLDHVLAHLLVDELIKAQIDHPDNRYSFRSYCGGFPKNINDFRYKFSWSPLGVLKALKSAARWIEHGHIHQAKVPWTALKSYKSGPADEIFEAYPNRDSLPFKEQYAFPPHWQLDEFVRGTLRLHGWAQAWQGIFAEVEHAAGLAGEARLAELAADLQSKHSYKAGEPDRVVLSVALEVKREGNTIWHKEYSMDAAGNDRGQAMARLVSLPVAFAVESLQKNGFPSGVHAAPRDRETIESWMRKLVTMGEHVEYTDHLSPAH